MKRYIPYFFAGLIVAIGATLSSFAANASAYDLALKASSINTANAVSPRLAGYYGDHYEEDYDDHYKHRRGRDYCGYTRYTKEYVCEHTQPRCFKQRECIWHYGREYCRYVRKCVGGEKYCKWVNVPVHNCGHYNSW